MHKQQPQGAVGAEGATVHTVRQDRRDGATGQIKRGPTHIIHTWNQTWCGRKIKGFRSFWNENGNLSDVDCKVCLTARATNRPRAWKSR